MIAAIAALLLLAASPHQSDWDVSGRPVPTPERIQPALDDALPRYRSCRADVAGKVKGNAPAILPDLVKRWTTAFATRHPEATISVAPPFGAPQGTLNPGLQSFLEGKLDFAFISRDLTLADLATFRRSHGFDPVAVPVAGGSWRHFGFVDTVVIIVNEANPVRQISFSQLDAIFSSSRLRGRPPVVDWGDLGVTQWADNPVHIIGASSWKGEDSARGTVVRDRILSVPGQRGSWREGLEPDSGTEADVPKRVATDPYAIGFTGLGHILPGTRPLAISPSESGPFIAPDYHSVAKGLYPLGRTVDLLVARRPGTSLDPLLSEFVRFLLSREGQEIVRKQGLFLPLTAAQVEEGLRLIGKQCRESR